MSRYPRLRSENDYYHIMTRGVSRHILFEEEADYKFFLHLLEGSSREFEIDLHAYCLMSNHYHLLLHSPLERIAVFENSLNGAYARYFNAKYDRIGSLFQDRFKSEPIESDSHYLTVLRYILQNPEKAGMGPSERYPWSSYQEYLQDGSFMSSMVNASFALDLLGGMQELLHFLKSNGSEKYLEVEDDCRKPKDGMLIRFINNDIGVSPSNIVTLRKPERDCVLRKLKANGFSVRQIERITGIGRGIIQRA